MGDSLASEAPCFARLAPKYGVPRHSAQCLVGHREGLRGVLDPGHS